MGGAPGLRAVLLAALLLAAEARAQANPPNVGLRPKVLVYVSYEAPGNCPTAHDFGAGVTARTELVQLSDDPDAPSSVQVAVRPTGHSYAARLVIAGRQGARSTRDVEDSECANLVDALALITALAFDPDAPLLPSPPVPAAALSTAQPSRPEDAPVSLAPRAAEPPLGRPAEHLASAAPATLLGWHLNAAIEGDVMGGAAPDALVGGGGYGELASSGHRFLSPSVRLAFLGAVNGAFETRSAAFTLLTARADGCPVRFGTDTFALRPCAAVEVGDLLARGTSVAKPASSGSAWFALSLLARAHWELRRPAFLDVDGGVLVPVSRPTFVYQLPSETVYRPSVAPAASISAGVRFW
jgi:hypothetical protein